MQARSSMAGCAEIYEADKKKQSVEPLAAARPETPQTHGSSEGQGLQTKDVVVKEVDFDPPASPTAEARLCPCH